MKTVAGVFRSRERAAQAAAHLREAGVGNINLLFPGAAEQQVNALPTSQTEQPGMGKAVGGVLGASLGIVGSEQRLACLPTQDGGQFPGQVVRLGDPSSASQTTGRWLRASRVPYQEDPALLEAISHEFTRLIG